MGIQLLKRYIVIALILSVLSGSLHAQIIKGAFMAGINVSQVDGDEVYGFNKVGLNIGAAAIVPLADRWDFSIETIYSQKGSYQKPQNEDSLSAEYRLKLNYLEVPVLIHFNDKDKIRFGLGMGWGRLVGVEEYEHGQRVESTNLEGPYSRNDYTGLADVRFRIYKGIKFNVRYSYSFVKIRTREYHPPNGSDPWTRKQYNNYWTFRLIYVFNEKQSDRARYENR